MNNPVALFREAAEAGALADSGLLSGAESELEALVCYELWRAAFMHGNGALVTAERLVLTRVQVERDRSRRWRAVRRMKGGRR